MKAEMRQTILRRKSPRAQWSLGKYLYSGVTSDGFPWIAFETRNFGFILVGISRDGQEPKSKMRNDSRSSISVSSYSEAARSAEQMAKQLVY